MNRLAVFVYAMDPVSQIGIAAQLRASPEVQVVGDSEAATAQVAVLVVDVVDPTQFGSFEQCKGMGARASCWLSAI